MGRIHRPLGGHPRSTWVGLFAVLMLAALPLLATSTFGAPATQGLQPTIYLPRVMRPSPYRIAFVSYRDGNSEIYVMNAYGSGQTNLSKNPKYDGEPVWSPMGIRLPSPLSRMDMIRSM